MEYQPRKQGDLPDDSPVTIRVQEEDDKSSKIFKVSRQRLVRNSPELQRRLVGDNNQQGMTETLCLEDVTFNLLQHMMRFINTDRIPTNLCVDELVDLLVSAQRHEMNSLVFQCECDLMKRIENKTACKLYELSKKIRSTSLRRWCLAFLRNDIIGVQKYFSDLSAASLKELLSLNRLNVPSEEFVLELVLMWTKCKGMDPSHEDFGTLLDCVRWQFITPDNAEKFTPEELAFYQDLATESKSSNNSVNVSRWDSVNTLNDTRLSWKEQEANFGSPSSRSSENGESPLMSKVRRRSKSSEYDEDDLSFDGEVFKHINATGRRYGTPQELESVYQKLFGNGKRLGSGRFRNIRKRSSCTSQDRLMLYVSGDKNRPRLITNGILPFLGSLRKDLAFDVDLPTSVAVRFTNLKCPVNICFSFNVFRRLRLHKVVMEFCSDTEIGPSLLEGYEFYLRKKTEHLRKTFGTVEKMELYGNELTTVTALGCDLYECVCQMPRPVPLSAESQYKVEMSVGKNVVRWSEFCLTFDQLKNFNNSAVKIPEQTTLAVKRLCCSFYD